MTPRLALHPDHGHARAARFSAYLQSLAGPRDDMWGVFADQATPFALHADGQTVGFCTIRDPRELVSFYLEPPYTHLAPHFLDLAIQQQVTAACPMTVDPCFLGPCLDRARACETLAVQYELVLRATPASALPLRLATVEDLEVWMPFVERNASGNRSFLVPYLHERVHRQELWLHEHHRQPVACGECRADPHHPQLIHLGAIVGAPYRRQQLGTQLIRTLTESALRGGRLPLASTSPNNPGAQAVLHQAGFRPRHRVLRVTLA